MKSPYTDKDNPKLESVMRAKMRWTGRNVRDIYKAERREEAEWTLRAIVGAILSGELPPDDAFAWARIAACEAKALKERA